MKSTQERHRVKYEKTSEKYNATPSEISSDGVVTVKAIIYSLSEISIGVYN